MSYNDSDDSEGEGFIPNKMIIKKRETAELKEDDNSTHFQPHYIIGETVIKKEVPESCLPITSIHRQNFQIITAAPSDIKGELPTAAQLFLSQNYELVYSRFKKPFGEGGKAAFTNEVVIRSTGRFENFRGLKNWRSDNNSTTVHRQGLLRFDSKFEGGNLLCAFQSLIETDSYFLFIQNDTNTYGYNQWFYFSVREAKPNRKYTFRIVNFKKNYSFFKKGMQPYIFSLEEHRSNGGGWYMGGTEFQYYRSNFAEKQAGSYYTLAFQYECRRPNDFVTISSSLPYSYSKLIQQINLYQAIATERALDFDLKSVSKTLGGNEVPYIKLCKRSEQKKRIIMITARQHSGETWSSYLMDEIIKGIVKHQDQYYRWLIQNFDFHIFPMINIDGVIYGNFRCDLAGYDLNRCWKDPSPILQPHIFRIKQEMQSLIQDFSLHLYLDLHTHSKEHGVFAFSCVQSPQCRKIPNIISSLTPLFRYSACTFGISAQKKATARSEIYELSGSIRSITIQLSAFGYRHPSTQSLQPFTLQNIQAVAQSILNSFYYDENPCINLEKINSYISESTFGNVRPFFDDEGAVSGSDSDPEVDAIEQSIKVRKILKELRAFDSKIKKNKPKVKKLKTHMNTAASPEPNDGESVSNSPVNRYRAITESSKLKKDETASESRQFLSSTCAPQRTVRSFKKMLKTSKLAAPGPIDSRLNSSMNYDHFVNPPKPLNLLEFSLKKLPIYNYDKSTLACPMPIEKRDKAQVSSISISKNVEHERQRSRNNVVTFYRTKKEGNASICISNSNNNTDSKDPYQFLCIMSESKKIEQIQKIKERRQNKQNPNKIVNKVRYALIKQSTVLQRYTRNKKPQTSETISKIWIKNFNRYSKSLEDDID